MSRTVTAIANDAIAGAEKAAKDARDAKGLVARARQTLSLKSQALSALEAIELTCPNCDADMGAHSCKLKCTRCGYFKSCSDF